jgi:hypothetical protein
MAEQNTDPVAGQKVVSWGRAFGLVGLGALVVGLAYGGASGFCWRTGDGEQPTPQPQPGGSGTSIGGKALFADWPAGARPDAVLVLSGQTFGYVQPCGCTRPQFGGLERRANFINGLKAKGWPVAAADLGDIYPPKGVVADQSMAKYVTMMKAYQQMGYVAVGLGKSEFTANLLNVLTAHAWQKEQPPHVLAGNLVGVTDTNGQRVPVPREKFFDRQAGPNARPVVGLAEVADYPAVAVGLVGVVGPSLAREAVKLDPGIDFLGNKEVLGEAVRQLDAHPKKPPVRVLLYQGTEDEAKKVAEDWPQFQVILCQAEDPEPPQFPAFVTHADGRKTMIVQVGHKGRYVGVVGAFRTANGGYDLRYQLVPLGEEFVTPDEPAAEKANPALPLLEEYARLVKDRNYLAKVPQTPHPAQVQAPNLNLTFVGSDRCMACHPGEYTKWKDTPHSHALEALEKVARRPGLRNFDGECVVCHTIGFGYKTGYEDEKKTRHLKHVGCENCHGPGSGHMANPNNPQLLALLAPWKQERGDRLPDPETMDKLAKMNPAERGQVRLAIGQQRAINGVTRACRSCHDDENDPHFDLFKYWPKVNHSGLGGNGAGEAAKN